VQSLEDRCLPSTFQELPLPPLQRDPLDEFHRERITTGPDGNLWFTDGVYGAAAVGRLSPDGTVTEFPIEDHTDTQLYTITAGPDGNLWLLAVRNTVGQNDEQLVAIRVTPDGTLTVFDVFANPFVSNVSPLVVDSDGNLWYTASFYSGSPASIVGRITPAGDVTNFDVGLIDIAEFGVGGGITAGPDGNLWVSIGDGIHGEPRGVRRFSPDGQLSDVIPGSQALSEMVTDPNGNVWGLVWTDQIERIAPDGTVSDFPLPVHQPLILPIPELDPLRMTLAVGPDGNIWFSDPYANQIGNITPDGTVSEYAVPTPASLPAGITAGPDGNIWFTELGSGQIGEFVLNDGVSARRAAPPSAAGVGPVPRTVTLDPFVTGGRLEVGSLGVGSEPAATPAGTSRPEAITSLPTSSARAEGSTAPLQHPETQSDEIDPLGLTGLLGETL
jgi:streptogramin lyase